MKPGYILQTMALSFAEICQGEEPWIALGNFMNDWFADAKDRREALVIDPLPEPKTWTRHRRRWAAFIAASVEWLCQRYGVSCPSWVHDSRYVLPRPWFHLMLVDTPEIRAELIKETPEPFARRNIYCGDDIYANKYELAERYERRRQERKRLQEQAASL